MLSCIQLQARDGEVSHTQAALAPSEGPCAVWAILGPSDMCLSLQLPLSDCTFRACFILLGDTWSHPAATAALPCGCSMVQHQSPIHPPVIPQYLRPTPTTLFWLNFLDADNIYLNSMCTSSSLKKCCGVRQPQHLTLI